MKTDSFVENRSRIGGASSAALNNVLTINIMPGHQPKLGFQGECVYRTLHDEDEDTGYATLTGLQSSGSVSFRLDHDKYLYGHMEATVWCENIKDQSRFYITDHLPITSSMYVGIKLKSYLYEGTMYLAAVAYDDDNNDFLQDYISEYIDWNHDTEFQDYIHDPQREYKISRHDQLGGAVNISQLLDQGFEFDPELTHDTVIHANEYSVYTPGGGYEDFHYVYEPNLKTILGSPDGKWYWHSYRNGFTSAEYPLLHIVDMTD